MGLPFETPTPTCYPPPPREEFLRAALAGLAPPTPPPTTTEEIRTLLRREEGVTTDQHAGHGEDGGDGGVGVGDGSGDGDGDGGGRGRDSASSSVFVVTREEFLTEMAGYPDDYDPMASQAYYSQHPEQVDVVEPEGGGGGGGGQAMEDNDDDGVDDIYEAGWEVHPQWEEQFSRTRARKEKNRQREKVQAVRRMLQQRRNEEETPAWLDREGKQDQRQ